MTTLFLVTALFRGFVPLDPSPGPYAALLLLGVATQEAARALLWRFHRLSLRALEWVAGLEEHAGAALTVADHFSLALTHGLAHASVHSVLLCVAWLPLALGDGTLYAAACPHLSFYWVSALTTLGVAGVLAGGGVLAFEGLERGSWRPAAAVGALHLGVALATLGNFAAGGCLVTVPVVLVTGGGVAAAAGRIWWRRTGQALERRRREAPPPEALGGALQGAEAAVEQRSPRARRVGGSSPRPPP